MEERDKLNFFRIYGGGEGRGGGEEGEDIVEGIMTVSKT